MDEQRFDEPSLRATAALLWRRKAWIVVGAAVGLLAGSLFLHLVAPLYTATFKVVPVDAQSSGSGGTMSRVSNLATAVGIGLPRGAAELSFIIYGEAIYSFEVASVLADDPVLMHKIFSSEWNVGTQRWRKPDGGFVDAIRPLKNALGFPRRDWSRPDATRLRHYLEARVSYEQSTESPVATVRFEHEDPRFATSLLERLNVTADNYLRRRGLAKSRTNINYLERKLRSVTLAEHRQVITSSLGEQERAQMMASSSTPYAAEPIGVPLVSEGPTSPKPLMVLLAGLLLGILAPATAILLFARPRRID